MIANVLFVTIILYGLIVRNTLIRKQKRIILAFSSVDTLINKKFGLLPALADLLQPYAEDGDNALHQLSELASLNYLSLSEDEKTEFDRIFTATEQQLLTMAENHPQLQTSEKFIRLRQSLSETEKQLSAPRHAYNTAVTAYNKTITTFPSNIIAHIFSFAEKELLAVPEKQDLSSRKYQPN